MVTDVGLPVIRSELLRIGYRTLERNYSKIFMPERSQRQVSVIYFMFHATFKLTDLRMRQENQNYEITESFPLDSVHQWRT